jgi:hypothetical protein
VYQEGDGVMLELLWPELSISEAAKNFSVA